jgi:TolB-like protein
MNNGSPLLPNADIPSRIMLDEVEVRQESNELLIAGKTVRLKPKVMAVLTQLIEARGGVVTKSQLLDRVWPNMAVTESAITEAIHDIRRALSDDARNPRFVQTIFRRGYRMVASISLPDRTPTEPPTAKKVRPRIAVTCFRSLSADLDDEFFCEGLCEELINSLGRNRHVEVVARTSTLEASADEADTRLIADRLGASHLVTGTFRRNGKRIRVLAHLIDGVSGTQIWSDVYDHDVEDMIAVQDDIARQIGAAVTPQLDVDREWTSRYTPDLEAFREFSKGRYFWKQDNANPDRPMSHYDKAMQIDPAFAAPYAGMVECYNTLGVFHLMPQAEARDGSIRNAEQALFLEPDSPESLFAFGYSQFYMRWNWRTAEAAFKKCLSINPNHVLAHAFLSLLYCPLRRQSESQAHAKKATQLDPFSPLNWWLHALQCHYHRDFENCLFAAEQGLELRPEDALLRWAQADSLVRLHRKSIALQKVAEFDARTSAFPLFHACACLLYTMLDRQSDALRVEKELQCGRDEDPEDPFVCSLVAIAHGQADRALDLLERAERERDAVLWIVACEPYFDLLRGNERYVGLLRRLRLDA